MYLIVLELMFCLTTGLLKPTVPAADVRRTVTTNKHRRSVLSQSDARVARRSASLEILSTTAQLYKQITFENVCYG